MRAVKLSGILGEKYGQEWTLDVCTPAEALRAINANQPGFLQYLCDSERDGITYRIMLDDRDIEVDELTGPYGRETFHLVPVYAGAGKNSGNIAKTVIGAVLAVVAIVVTYGAASGYMAAGGSLAGAMTATSFGFISMSTLALFGVSMMLNGISGILANGNQAGNTDAAENKPSYVFNGPVNTVAQGGPVPLGYGELIVGSYVISGGIEAQPYSLGAA